MSIKPGSRKGDEDSASSIAAAGQYAGLGLQFAMAVSLFTWLGWIADNRLGWTPILTILGAFVGAGGGFYSLYRRLVLESQDAGGSD